MMRVPTAAASKAAWMATPLGRSLLGLSPRWWRRRRVAEVSIALLSLMQDLQSHRGLSCAVLDGQHGFDDELAAVGGKLQRSLHMFAEQYGDRYAVFRCDTWQNILARWDSLRGNWQTLDFHTNLSVHSELVLGVVAMLRNLATVNHRSLPPLSVRVLAEWPTMVEHLGLLRAIGVNRLGHPDEPMELRLAALYRVHLHEARSTLASVADDLDTPALLEACQQTIELAAALRGSLPQGVDASAYYADLTAVIDAWYATTRRQLLASTGGAAR